MFSLLFAFFTAEFAATLPSFLDPFGPPPGWPWS